MTTPFTPASPVCDISVPDVSLPKVSVIGAGLAGCEAALTLAKAGIRVRLYDQKPTQRSEAHHQPTLAEIVCSNSLGSQGASASGLLKEEMILLGSSLLPLAKQCSVPAGKALAVDREGFTQTVTEVVRSHPLIEFVCQDVQSIPSDTPFTIVATGPLTTVGMAETLSQLTGRERLFFFDAAAPIVSKESVNLEVAFFQDRYNKRITDTGDLAVGTQGDGEAAYLNCPLNQAEYERLVQFILEAEKIPLKSFEAEAAGKTRFFESCMPVEVIASRGTETLRFGPMKPVGIRDPRTDKTPYAVVQLRQDNAEGTLYNLVGFQTNLRWGAQKDMMALIPGLEQAEIVRYGVMHRNTYLHSPEVLKPTLQLQAHPSVFIAGQLTGTEGYTESIATGLWAALNVIRLLAKQEAVVLPPSTMLGALCHYITRTEAKGGAFQPINSNWGIMAPLVPVVKDKRQRPEAYVERSLTTLKSLIASQAVLLESVV
jgi:methylenetetrahydrofolate--tRNA-(uracil-5-)-methyltransferase